MIDTLKLADRCDQCGSAQAFYRMIKAEEAGNLYLDFCAHHYATNEEALVLSGWDVLDDATGTLNVKPSISANAV